jgi:ribosomal protein S18 acetylase RimI-like enzyme
VLALWREAEAPPSPTDGPDSLRTLIRRDPEALLVAEARGEVVGSLIVGWDGWRGNLYRLAVLPAQRRTGVARRLVREGVRRLQERGAVRINALVIRSDTAATGFWRAAGFTHDARMARFRREVANPPRSSDGGVPKLAP